MSNILSDIKEKVSNIDAQQIVADTKEKLEYLDMGTVLGDTVRAFEKIDVKAIKSKVTAISKDPIVEKVEDGVKAAVAVPVEFVKGFIGK